MRAVRNVMAVCVVLAAVACASIGDLEKGAGQVQDATQDAAKAATMALLEARSACARYELSPVRDPELDAFCAELRGECAPREAAP